MAIRPYSSLILNNTDATGFEIMEKKLLDNSKGDRPKMPNKHLSSIFLSTIVQWIQQHQDERIYRQRY
ncbi:MAG: hypothetical protein F6K23_38145 [Okeania sp. SIO2C9]|uniref:hypothetical protein n=1 Tax=Okeania sp. SIO2C9 TaxID=2607791 RepID=UPI0013C126BE|nr:hypothetical protein [Okeania sp. SIO2C9]NEQ78300.1 hypothetical protein [Okeania sp. SIO2C9]